MTNELEALVRSHVFSFVLKRSDHDSPNIPSNKASAIPKDDDPAD
jgi:hypothetical protein